MKNLYITYSHRDLDLVLGRYKEIKEKTVEGMKSRLVRTPEARDAFATSEDGEHFNYIALYKDKVANETAIARIEDEKGNVLDTRVISMDEMKTVDFPDMMHYSFPERMVSRFFMAKKFEAKFIVPDDFDFNYLLFHYQYMFRFGNGEEFLKRYKDGNLFVGKTNIDPTIIYYKGLRIFADDCKVEAYEEGQRIEYYFVLKQNKKITDADVYEIIDCSLFADKNVTLSSQVEYLKNNE